MNVSAPNAKTSDIVVTSVKVPKKLSTGTYSKMKVNELKTLLKQRGLPVSGRKGDLVARLTNSEPCSQSPAPIQTKKKNRLSLSPASEELEVRNPPPFVAGLHAS